MGNRIGEQDGYPAGVSNADFAGEEPPCHCGHVPDEHEGFDGPCEVEDCGCVAYETDYGDV